MKWITAPVGALIGATTTTGAIALAVTPPLVAVGFGVAAAVTTYKLANAGADAIRRAAGGDRGNGDA